MKFMDSGIHSWPLKGSERFELCNLLSSGTDSQHHSLIAAVQNQRGHPFSVPFYPKYRWDIDADYNFDSPPKSTWYNPRSSSSDDCCGHRDEFCSIHCSGYNRSRSPSNWSLTVSPCNSTRRSNSKRSWSNRHSIQWVYKSLLFASRSFPRRRWTEWEWTASPYPTTRDLEWECRPNHNSTISCSSKLSCPSVAETIRVHSVWSSIDPIPFCGKLRSSILSVSSWPAHSIHTELPSIWSNTTSSPSL